MGELTESQISDLKYFWEEWGDLERMASFDDIKPMLQEEKPEVLKAWNEYKTSMKILDIIIKSL